MIIDIFDANVTREDVKGFANTTACRGIIEKDGKYLVVNLAKFDITTFPGGRLEKNETLEECCVREVLEETGVMCKVVRKQVSINEFFIDSHWTNVYFLCEFVEDTGITNFTDEEKDLQMKIEWRTLDELLETFENNMTLHEYGPNIHNREFLGLINSI